MEWPHVSSYVELLHSVTDMGTNIPMSLSEVKLLHFRLHFLYRDMFVLGIMFKSIRDRLVWSEWSRFRGNCLDHDCHGPKSTTAAMDQRFGPYWPPAVLRMLGGGLRIVLATENL